MEKFHPCKILKKAPWQRNNTKPYDTLDGWDWDGEMLTPMSELSESIAEEILEEFESDDTQPDWRGDRID